MPEPRTLPLAVAAVGEVTPHMRRIQLTGPSLEAFEYFPGQDLALPVVRDDGTVVRRRYTIRRFDPERRLIDLDVVMHGDGPGIRWAQSARPGLAIEAIGPRGKIGLDPNARLHLFAGDATAVPGSLAMIEALPAGVPAFAFLMVGDPAEQQSFTFVDTM
jgi:NADPH-dependent ferric siderophore reductase